MKRCLSMVAISLLATAAVAQENAQVTEVNSGDAIIVDGKLALGQGKNVVTLESGRHQYHFLLEVGADNLYRFGIEDGDNKVALALYDAEGNAIATEPFYPELWFGGLGH